MSILGSNYEITELPNGQFRHDIHLRPIAYLENGSYRYINNDWGDSGDGTYPHIITAAPMMYSSGPTGAKRIHPTREQDVYVELGRIWHRPAGTWVQAPMNSLTRSGNKLTSTNTNYDLIITALGHGLKFDLIRKNGFWPANNTIAFPASLTGLTRTGNTLYKNGVPVALLRAPVVYDVNDPGNTLPIGISFGAFGSQTGVIFALPTEAQLTTAGITAPAIDPTLDIQPDGTAGIDTYVSGPSADTNFGTSTVLEMRTSTNLRHTLIKFDLSGIPVGATITGGNLHTWNEAQPAANHTITIARIRSVNSAWTEAGATWNYAVASTTRWAGDTGADGGVDAGCGVAGTDYSNTAMGTFVVESTDTAGTQQIAALLLSELELLIAGNHGLHLRSDQNAVVQLRSSDHATAGTRPKLSLTYTVPAGSSVNAFTRPRRRRYKGA